MIVQLQLFFTTVVQLLNQGTIRHRGVSDGGLLFCFFFGEAKKIENKICAPAQTNS
jgi:hypothetical protein